MRRLRLVHWGFVLSLLLGLGVGMALAEGGVPGNPQAAVGSGFTYQGYLEKGGSPVDDLCAFRFSLWDAPVGGSQIGSTQEITGTLVKGGYFTVPDLDFGAGVFNGEARYLEIALQCTGDSDFTTLAGRDVLAATPYAHYALAAPWAGLMGVPAGFADGVDDTGADWSLGGNGGTVPGTHFLGTTDEVALELRVNGARALRLEPDADSPNIVGGYGGNSVDAGAVGVVIGGGGASGNANWGTGNYDTVSGGYHNQAGDTDGNPATGQFATVGGGIDNTASGGRSTVGGGDSNIASGARSAVGGGWGNSASGRQSTVPGGYQNTASGDYSFAAGRRAKANHEGAFVWADATDADFTSTAADQFSVRATGGVRLIVDTDGGGLRLEPTATTPNVVGGHISNTVTSGVRGATIGGGGRSTGPNRVTDYFGTVGGGRNNQAGDDGDTLNNAVCATVVGGSDNVAWGYWSFIGGGDDNWAGQVAVVAGGTLNVVSATTGFIGGGWGNVITGTNMWYDDIVGGYQNLITGTAKWSHIGGGAHSAIYGNNHSFIGGGRLNVITGTNGAITIGGGESNTASGGRSTVGGGYSNEASGDYASTIAGGYNNTASGESATVSGGRGNTASGLRATVPGGYQNIAQGNHSFAAGHTAHAMHIGAFVWDGNTSSSLYSSGSGQFIARAPGGFWLGNTTGNLTPTIGSGVLINTSTGAYLSTGGTWTDSSDRALKENFEPVDPAEVLEGVVRLPVTTWNYKADDESIRHMGPVAQDFYAAFGLGADDKHIAALDSSGVALAAIQGLYEQNQAQAGRIERLEVENAELQAQVEELMARVEALEANPPLFPTDATFASAGGGWLGALLFGVAAVVLAQRGKGGRR